MKLLVRSHNECFLTPQGTVLLSPTLPFTDDTASCWEFEAKVFMLYITGVSVKQEFQATVYVASTMQTAIIKEIKEKVWVVCVCVCVCVCVEEGGG